MGLLQEIEEHFGVKNLYEAFDITTDASNSEIKKAYRKLSLKHHPDKFTSYGQTKIDSQTLKFQILGKIHLILSDENRRKLYDEQGIVEEDAHDLDWDKYWRTLFPKITKQTIEDYMKKYTGSDEEIEDLKKLYNRFEGDMNRIYEYMIGYDENRTRSMINELINNKELQPLPKFVNESRSSIEKRKRKLSKEKKEFEKSEENDDNDLVMAISQNMAKRESGFNSMLAMMEAKYGGKEKKKTKRMRK